MRSARLFRLLANRSRIHYDLDGFSRIPSIYSTVRAGRISDEIEHGVQRMSVLEI